MPHEESLLQRHSANLRHIRDLFRIDPRVGRGPGQIAPWISGVVRLTHPAFPGRSTFGNIRLVIVPLPGAGTDFTTTVPPEEIWRLRTAHCQLITDATAASREVRLELLTGGTPFYLVAPVTSQAASLVIQYSWGHGVTNDSFGLVLNTTLPDAILVPGSVVRSNIRLLQAGDILSSINMLVDVFPA